MAEKVARLGAAAFAVGLLLVGPQTAGVAAAERGEAGDSASASDNTRGSASADNSSDDPPSRSQAPEAGSDPVGDDGPDTSESEIEDVKDSLDESDVKDSLDDSDVKDALESEVEDSLDESEVEDSLDDSEVEDSLDKSDVEGPVDESDVEVSVDESDVEVSVDESELKGAVEETPAGETVTESPDGDPLTEPVGEESTEVVDPIILDDGVPGRTGGPDPLPWWRTTTVEDGSGAPDPEDLCGDCETSEVVWNYSGPRDDDLVALPVAVPDAGGEDETPAPVVGTPNGPAGQVIAILKMKVVEALDLALNWLSGLPTNQFTEFLSGALLLVRRTLLPDVEAGQATGGPGVSEPAKELPDGLVGLTESAAVDEAESGGWVARVVARDGEYFPVTLDYSTSRVNLTVVDGIVTTVSVG